VIASDMELSIIIPTKDRLPVVATTIASVQQAIAGMDTEVIVVNDSRTTEPTLPDDPRFRALRNPDWGATAARNHGARHAQGDLLLFLDNDILITSESLQRTIELHRDLRHSASNPDWVYPPAMQALLRSTAFGRYLQAAGQTSQRSWNDDPAWKDGALFRSRTLASFHFCIERADFDRMGGYDIAWPQVLFGDVRLAQRLADAGIDTYIDTRIQVLHNEADRMEVTTWLDNWNRRGQRMRLAADAGVVEWRLPPVHPLKDVLLLLLGLTRGSWRYMVTHWPFGTWADPLFKRLLDGLFAESYRRGYHHPPSSASAHG
jgi:glycosyltransferase involved in cell wall biosynthesis